MDSSLLFHCGSLFLTFSVFDSWAGAVVLNFLAMIVFGLWVDVVTIGEGPGLAAVVSGV